MRTPSASTKEFSRIVFWVDSFHFLTLHHRDPSSRQTQPLIDALDVNYTVKIIYPAFKPCNRLKEARPHKVYMLMLSITRRVILDLFVNCSPWVRP